MGQQRFATRTTGYIDSTSLAHPLGGAHQEYKLRSGIRVSSFPEKDFIRCGKLAPVICPFLQDELGCRPRFPRLPLADHFCIVDLVGKQMRTRPLPDFSHTVIRSGVPFFTACVR
jgi:hypothetical protein